jgi:hypothetical protein
MRGDDKGLNLVDAVRRATEKDRQDKLTSLQSQP